MNMLLIKANEKNINLILDDSLLINDLYRGDPLRLRQVLINLVSNASKFTHHGEIVVQVAVNTKKDSGEMELIFRVKDTGIGIPQDKMHTLFRAFSQVDSSTTRKYGGTGLGLVISENLVQLMKGTMQVESQPGQGSTFSFTILTSPVLSSVPDNTTGIEILKGKKILVVDDNQTNLFILQKQLKDWEIDVTIAGSGQEALQFDFKSAPFDLVLTDMHMSHMNGIVLATEIKKINPAVPVMLLSSVGDNFRNVPGNLFVSTLTKPVKQLILLNLLFILETCD